MKRLKGYVVQKFLTLSGERQSRNELYNTLKNCSYNDENGFGTTNVTLIDSTISVNILKRSPTFVSDYDVLSNQIVKKQIFLYNQINFDLDMKNQLLIIHGSLSDSANIKSFFRKYSDSVNNLVTNVVNIDLNQLFKRLSLNYYKTYIRQLTVKRFNFQNGIVGRFSGEVVDQNIGNMLLSDYNKDIVKATFSLVIDDNKTFEIQVFPVGSLKVLSEEEDHEIILNILKTYILD